MLPLNLSGRRKNLPSDHNSFPPVYCSFVSGPQLMYSWVSVFTFHLKYLYDQKKETQINSIIFIGRGRKIQPQINNDT